MNPFNHIERIKIQNFKSIKRLELYPKKVNIFIGEPNVGKSNILEAFGLISALGNQDTISQYIRYQEYANIFFKGFLDRKVNLDFDLKGKKYNIEISYNDNVNRFQIFTNEILKGKLSNIRDRSDDFIKNNETYGSSGTSHIPITKYYSEFYKILDIDEKLADIKYYKFRIFDPSIYTDGTKRNEPIEGTSMEINQDRKLAIHKIKILKTPNGDNIYNVIKNTEKSRNAFRDLIEDFGLKLIIDTQNSKLQILKEEDGVYFTLPLYSLADTLQSVFFYQTAILSNKNNVLIFEEPESHTFPFYTTILGEMIAEDRTNQFFIATHNPYFLNAIFSKTKAIDLQIYIVKTENGDTKVYPLTQKELDVIFDGDMFTNISHLDDWLDENQKD